MQRRDFLIAAAAALTLPSSLGAYSGVAWRPATWAALRDEGAPMVLNFRADWSLTCQRKTGILADLVAANPAYSEITFVDVNWDYFAKARWVERMEVTRRSTLVAMKGETEIARLVAQPEEARIRALLDAALAA